MIAAPSPNFNERKLPVDMIVIHYTDVPTAKDALSILQDPESQVSAHYLIDENGDLYSPVDPSKRAWHAGVSYWKGESDINSRSVGIELQNPGHSGGLQPFTEEQLDVLEALILSLKAIYVIPDENIVGHSDIAPGRKIDPGPYFPWAYFKENYGWGLPILENPTPEALLEMGYDPEKREDIVKSYLLGRDSEAD